MKILNESLTLASSDRRYKTGRLVSGRRIAAMMIISAFCVRLVAADLVTHDVCAVLAAVGRPLRPSYLRVRGELRLNKYHGEFFLTDMSVNDGACPIKPNDNKLWKSSLAVEWPPSIEVSANDPAYGDLRRLKEQLARAKIGLVVFGIFEGRLITRDRLTIGLGGGNRPKGTGFGPDGAFAAQFNIMEVVKIIRVQEY